MPIDSPPIVAIQRNRGSGTGWRRGLLRELVRGLKLRGLVPRLFTRRERLARWMESERHRKELRCLVAAGGDGTLGDLLNRFPGVPIALLPLGTENLAARYFCVPPNGDAVAEMIARGRSCRVDVGLAGARRFLAMASAGFDADVVHRTHLARSGNISHVNYVQRIWESLRRYEHAPMQIWLDGRPYPLTGRLVVVANLPVYALGLPVAAAASGDDGQFDVTVFEQGSAWQMLRYFCNVAARRLPHLSDVRSCRARHVRIESSAAVPLQVDGDPAGSTPVELSILPGEVELLVADHLRGV